MILTHQKIDKREVRKIIHLLELVKVPNPENRLKYYPHQLSGGQRQEDDCNGNR